MAGNKSGGIKARDANLARDPNFYKRIGTTGGSRGTTGGFFVNRELASYAGKLGGLKSTRTKGGVAQWRELDDEEIAKAEIELAAYRLRVSSGEAVAGKYEY